VYLRSGLAASQIRFGSVVNKLEGASGRIDYHIVAACSFGDKVLYHDVGYIYHTTNWMQNIYHAQAPSLD